MGKKKRNRIHLIISRLVSQVGKEITKFMQCLRNMIWEKVSLKEKLQARHMRIKLVSQSE